MAVGDGELKSMAGGDRPGDRRCAPRQFADTEAAAVELEKDRQYSGVPCPGGDAVKRRDGGHQVRGFQCRRILWQAWNRA